MTMTDDKGVAGEPLQFEVAESGAHDPSLPQGTDGVHCSFCRRAVETEYFQVNDRPACTRCRKSIDSELEKRPGWDRFAVASLFGLGAAIAGAMVYYAVIRLLNLEIGIVAILIGYMVGYSVRKGAGGRGARRFQILAVVLTYWAVGLAYSPLVFSDLSLKDSKAATVDPGHAPAGASRSDGSIAAALVYAFAFIFALPILMVVGSLPSGLISAFIIGIGMRQAWRMTSAIRLQMSGPYRVGAVQSATPA
jgi:hypothetical protein